MDIAVIGVTPVGCTIAALLNEAGQDVTIIGQRSKVERIRSGGITVRQVWDGRVLSASVKTAERLDHVPDMVVFAARTQDTMHAALDAEPFVRDADIATVQYGTKTEQIVARTLPRDSIVTCVLTMGATCYSPGDVTLNFKGHMVCGKAYAAPRERVERVARVMSGVFNTHIGQKIAHFNCTRLLLNLPYCIPAIVGEKIQKAFMDHRLSRVAVQLLKEGTKVIEEAEVKIEPLPDFNEKTLKDLLAAPLDEAAVRFSEIAMNMSKVPCQGPILGSIEQGEPSEIDFQNGEMVKIAGVTGFPAGLNSLMVELVHRVEDTGSFLTKREFIEKVEERAGELDV